MKKKQHVLFRKQRDVSAIIADTYVFLKLEGKSFFGTILRTAMVPILIAIAGLFFCLNAFPTALDGLEVNMLQEEGVYQEVNFGIAFISFLAVAIFFMIVYIVINITVLYYIESYIQNKGTIDYAMIQERLKDKFWSFAGVFVLMGLIIVCSVFLCFFPVIYTSVVLALATPILVFRKLDVSDTIEFAFKFMNGHWWETFGIMLLIGLITTVISYICAMPALIYRLNTAASHSTGEVSMIASVFTDPLYVLLNGFSYIVQFLLYGITLVSNVFLYFDIDEQKQTKLR